MWKELASCLRLGKTIDSGLHRAMAAEKAHWRSVLTRVIECILFACYVSACPPESRQLRPCHQTPEKRSPALLAVCV
jgi:hypothetical protein